MAGTRRTARTQGAERPATTNVEEAAPITTRTKRKPKATITAEATEKEETVEKPATTKARTTRGRAKAIEKEEVAEEEEEVKPAATTRARTTRSRGKAAEEEPATEEKAEEEVAKPVTTKARITRGRGGKAVEEEPATEEKEEVVKPAPTKARTTRGRAKAIEKEEVAEEEEEVKPAATTRARTTRSRGKAAEDEPATEEKEEEVVQPATTRARTTKGRGKAVDEEPTTEEKEEVAKPAPTKARTTRGRAKAIEKEEVAEKEEEVKPATTRARTTRGSGKAVEEEPATEKEEEVAKPVTTKARITRGRGKAAEDGPTPEEKEEEVVQPATTKGRTTKGRGKAVEEEPATEEKVEKPATTKARTTRGRAKAVEEETATEEKVEEVAKPATTKARTTRGRGKAVQETPEEPAPKAKTRGRGKATEEEEAEDDTVVVAPIPAPRRGRSASPAPAVPELDEKGARAIGKALRGKAVPKPNNRVAKTPAKPKRGRKVPSPATPGSSRVKYTDPQVVIETPSRTPSRREHAVLGSITVASPTTQPEALEEPQQTASSRRESIYASDPIIGTPVMASTPTGAVFTPGRGFGSPWNVPAAQSPHRDPAKLQERQASTPIKVFSPRIGSTPQSVKSVIPTPSKSVVEDARRFSELSPATSRLLAGDGRSPVKSRHATPRNSVSLSSPLGLQAMPVLPSPAKRTYDQMADGADQDEQPDAWRRMDEDMRRSPVRRERQPPLFSGATPVKQTAGPPSDRPRPPGFDSLFDSSSFSLSPVRISPSKPMLEEDSEEEPETVPNTQETVQDEPDTAPSSAANTQEMVKEAESTPEKPVKEKPEGYDSLFDTSSVMLSPVKVPTEPILENSDSDEEPAEPSKVKFGFVAEKDGNQQPLAKAPVFAFVPPGAATKKDEPVKFGVVETGEKDTPLAKAPVFAFVPPGAATKKDEPVKFGVVETGEKETPLAKAPVFAFVPPGAATKKDEPVKFGVVETGEKETPLAKAPVFAFVPPGAATKKDEPVKFGVVETGEKDAPLAKAPVFAFIPPGAATKKDEPVKFGVVETGEKDTPLAKAPVFAFVPPGAATKKDEPVKSGVVPGGEEEKPLAKAPVFGFVPPGAAIKEEEPLKQNEPVKFGVIETGEKEMPEGYDPLFDTSSVLLSPVKIPSTEAMLEDSDSDEEPVEPSKVKFGFVADKDGNEQPLAKAPVFAFVPPGAATKQDESVKFGVVETGEKETPLAKAPVFAFVPPGAATKKDELVKSGVVETGEKERPEGYDPLFDTSSVLLSPVKIPSTEAMLEDSDSDEEPVEPSKVKFGFVAEKDGQQQPLAKAPVFAFVPPGAATKKDEPVKFGVVETGEKETPLAKAPVFAFVPPGAATKMDELVKSGVVETGEKERPEGYDPLFDTSSVLLSPIKIPSTEAMLEDSDSDEEPVEPSKVKFGFVAEKDGQQQPLAKAPVFAFVPPGAATKKDEPVKFGLVQDGEKEEPLAKAPVFSFVPPTTTEKGEPVKFGFIQDDEQEASRQKAPIFGFVSPPVQKGELSALDEPLKFGFVQSGEGEPLAKAPVLGFVPPGAKEEESYDSLFDGSSFGFSPFKISPPNQTKQSPSAKSAGFQYRLDDTEDASDTGLNSMEFSPIKPSSLFASYGQMLPAEDEDEAPEVPRPENPTPEKAISQPSLLESPEFDRSPPRTPQRATGSEELSSPFQEEVPSLVPSPPSKSPRKRRLSYVDVPLAGTDGPTTPPNKRLRENVTVAPDSVSRRSFGRRASVGLMHFAGDPLMERFKALARGYLVRKRMANREPVSSKSGPEDDDDDSDSDSDSDPDEPEPKPEDGSKNNQPQHEPKEPKKDADEGKKEGKGKEATRGPGALASFAKKPEQKGRFVSKGSFLPVPKGLSKIPKLGSTPVASAPPPAPAVPSSLSSPEPPTPPRRSSPRKRSAGDDPSTCSPRIKRAATAEARKSARSNLGRPPPLSLAPGQARTGPLTWDNMLERERKQLVKKNTLVNCAPAPHKQQIVKKAIPRPPSPTAEGQTRAAREARRKRKAHQMETGVELGPGEDVGFMPKVLTPPKKGVRWNAPLESGYSSDLEIHSPSAAKKMKTNNGHGLLVNSNVAMDQFGNLEGVSPPKPSTEPVVIKKVLYRGEA